VEQAYKIADLMPNAKLVVVEGAGHWPWLEEPGIVRSTLSDWLVRAGSAQSG
jgi:pimeloyl-ACP methyl ester carboxylesterase